jgi:predicted glycoside hydrolase/deacetylase ChbG (UPF0249 family)
VKYLIVNADDFGLSMGVNAGIVEAHERGLVTSTSLMVRRRGADGAAAYARGRAELAVGLHFDLGEWEFQAGRWKATYEVPVADIAGEVSAQLDAFRELMQREPTHLDSHQHVHRHDPARRAVVALGRELGVPVRHFDPRIRYWGGFYGQGEEGDSWPALIDVDALRAILAGLPEGVTELGCHPGYVEEGESSYASERAREVATLCDETLRSEIARTEIRLISFHDLEQALV